MNASMLIIAACLAAVLGGSGQITQESFVLKNGLKVVLRPVIGSPGTPE